MAVVADEETETAVHHLASPPNVMTVTPDPLPEKVAGVVGEILTMTAIILHPRNSDETATRGGHVAGVLIETGTGRERGIEMMFTVDESFAFPMG